MALSDNAAGLILFALDHMQNGAHSSEWEKQLATRAIDALLTETGLKTRETQRIVVKVLSMDTDRAVFEIRRAA